MSPSYRPVLDDHEIVNTLSPIPLAKIAQHSKIGGRVVNIPGSGVTASALSSPGAAGGQEGDEGYSNN